MNEENAVAIVGMGCRFPGANSPEELWRVLVNSENHVKEVPPDRWNTTSFHSSDRTAPGKTYAKHAGLIDDVWGFDHKLFGINKIEAENLDPQQRLALEVSYRALEDGGITLDSIRGTNASVYMGHMTDDYPILANVDEKCINNYSSTGTAGCILSNRLSYYYNVNGPSITIETACSSSSVCVHLGSKSILTGESDIAICGGVGCILSPTPFIILSKTQMSSEKGQCQSFTENADGYVRSEGCGVVILKNLQKARLDNDKIYGIIATSVNSDGKASRPLTNPSAEIQSRAMTSALARAHLKPEQIQFVEMHCTGTQTGDPVEIASVGKVYGASRKRLNLDPCPVGSHKTNVGHLEAASGVCGLMKMLLMMKHKTFVPSVLFGKLKESLNWQENHVSVLCETQEWEAVNIDGKQCRIGAVNAFGYGGTNTHTIVQSFDPPQNSESPSKVVDENCPVPQIVFFSGVDEKSLFKSLSDTLEVIKTNDDTSLDDLSYTSCHRRTHYKHRLAIPAESVSDLQNKLKSIVSGQKEVGTTVARVDVKNVVFVFCGMGTHWAGMGMRLYRTEPIFKYFIDRIQTLFSSFGEFNLLKCMEEQVDISDATNSQPSLFACQVALFELWKSKGVKPDIIVGHSVGEIAAAYASGQLCLESAAFLIFHRGRVLSKAEEGSMMAVKNIPVSRVQDLIDSLEGKLTIACYNSPNSCTVSGPTDEITQLQSSLELLNPKPFVRRLAVKVAYHSASMDPILPEFEKALQPCELKPGQRNIKQVSTVTGQPVESDKLQTVDYWKENIRDSVKFTYAIVESLSKEKSNVVIEIGPKPALRRDMTDIASDRTLILPSLTENNDISFYQSLTKAHEIEIINEPSGRTGNILRIPRYGFNKQFLCKNLEMSTLWRKGLVSLCPKLHPFVSKDDIHDDRSNNYKCTISPETTDFVYGHKVNDTITLPGAIYIEMGMAALSQLRSFNVERDDEVQISAGVNFKQVCNLKSESSKATLQIVCHKDKHDDSLVYFDVVNYEILHATGQISISQRSKGLPVTLDLKDLEAKHGKVVAGTDLYTTLEEQGYVFGPELKSIKTIRTSSNTSDANTVVVGLEIDKDIDLKTTVIHPSVLDSVMQSVGIFSSITRQSLKPDEMMIPYGIGQVSVYGKFKTKMVIYLKLDASQMKMDATICGTNGVILARCTNIQYGIVGRDINFDIHRSCFLPACEIIGQDELQLGKEPQSLNEGFLCLTDETCTFPIHEIASGREKKLIEKEIDSIINDDQVITTIIPNELKSCSSIVYLVGLHQNIPDIRTFSGKEMNNFVLRTNMALLQLVKLACKSKDFPAIYVITRGVHQLINDQSLENNHVLDAIIGQTTTAMCRTIAKERPALQLYCIDIDGTTATQMALVNQIISNPPAYYGQVVQNGTLMYDTMIPAGATDKVSGRKMRARATNNEVQMSYDQSENQVFLEPALQRNASFAVTSAYVDSRVLRNGADVNTKHVPIFNSIGTSPEGQKYHICQPHSLSLLGEIANENMLPWEDFPSAYPTLSFWVHGWNLFRKIPNSRRIRLLLDGGVSPIWKYVIQSLATIFGFQVTTDDVVCPNVLVVTRDMTGLPTFHNNEVVFVISESHVTSTYSDLAHLKHIEVAVPLLPAQKLRKRIQKFKTWISTIDRKQLQDELQRFDAALTERSDIKELDLGDATGPNIQLSKPTFVNMENKESSVSVVASQLEKVIKGNAGYLVIGGRKGLSWETVKYLISKGAKYVGVLSRSNPSQEKLEEGFTLEKQYGCRIIDLQADTSDMQQLSDAIQRFENDIKVPIKGLFYGAAVVSDSILTGMTKDKFERVITPKVAGVWNMFLLTMNMDLDILIMYSSISSMCGHIGQTNYTAGNGFKDAIACVRRGMRGEGQSICFGSMDLGILENESAVKKKLLAQGNIIMKIPEIKACLQHALMTNLPVVGYAKFDWKTWFHSSAPKIKKQYTPLLKRFCYAYQETKTGPRKRISHSNSNIDAYVIDILKSVTLISDDVSLDSTLTELGADSQDLQQMLNHFQEDIGFTNSDLSVVEIGRMTLDRLIGEINRLKQCDDKNRQKLDEQQ